MAGIMDVMAHNWPIDRYYGVKKGDLVRVNVAPSTPDDPDKLITGVVLDVWPAHVYEHSESVVLIGGYPEPHRITVRTSYLSLLEKP